MIKFKYRLICLCLCAFLQLHCFSQLNLVPNPSFEEMTGACDVQMGLATFNYPPPFIKNWYTPNRASPDYMHVCANPFAPISFVWESTVPKSRNGYQIPRTGNAYMGIGIYVVTKAPDSASISVEYISVQLKQALKKNSCYYAEFYVSLANRSEIAINQISLLLTQNPFSTPIYSFTNSLQPQVQWDTTKYFTDTLNWVKISGTFVAKGGEEHLTLGNFKDGLHTKKIGIQSNFISPEPPPTLTKSTFIFIDDVALYEIPKPQIPITSFTFCPNDESFVVGDAPQPHSRYQWFANGIAIATTSSISIKPWQNTTYVLQSSQCTVNTQSVIVTYSANCEPVRVVEPTIPNVFTPNGDGINDVWQFSMGKGNMLQGLMIYNRWGNVLTPTLSEGEGVEPSLNARISWDGSLFSAGVYFYIMQYTDVNGEAHTKNGYVSLIK